MPRIAERERPIPTAGGKADLPDVEHNLYVAVVHAVDGVRFTASAPSRRELVHRVAEYVQRWGGYVLRPDHARHLRSLLARGESEAAVELYFALVGKRWDKEWLITAAIDARSPRHVTAELGEVAAAERLREKRQVDVGSPREHDVLRERAG